MSHIIHGAHSSLNPIVMNQKNPVMKTTNHVVDWFYLNIALIVIY